jgi:hypothetical protein
MEIKNKKTGQWNMLGMLFGLISEHLMLKNGGEVGATITFIIFSLKLSS